jgi:hypothetical protein
LFSRRIENIEFFGFVLPNLVLFYQNRLIITPAALFACAEKWFLGFAAATRGGHLV